MMKTRLLLLGRSASRCCPLFQPSPRKKPKPAPAAPAVPAAADPGPAKPLGSAGSWTAYLAQNRGGKVCYLVGQPEKTEPAGMKPER